MTNKIYFSSLKMKRHSIKFGELELDYFIKQYTISEAQDIDFQIINFTRPEGGRRISYTSTTDNTVKLFI